MNRLILSDRVLNCRVLFIYMETLQVESKPYLL